MQEISSESLQPELFWLTATALMTSLFWVPYILNRLAELGVWPALSSPTPAAPPSALWAARMMRAHSNAVENLVVFAPLVVAVLLSHQASALTALMCEVYFFARLAHFVAYSAGVPLVRTLTFAVGWASCVVLALTVLGVM